MDRPTNELSNQSDSSIAELPVSTIDENGWTDVITEVQFAKPLECLPDYSEIVSPLEIPRHYVTVGEIDVGDVSHQISLEKDVETDFQLTESASTRALPLTPTGLSEQSEWVNIEESPLPASEGKLTNLVTDADSSSDSYDSGYILTSQRKALPGKPILEERSYRVKVVVPKLGEEDRRPTKVVTETVSTNDAKTPKKAPAPRPMSALERIRRYKTENPEYEETRQVQPAPKIVNLSKDGVLVEKPQEKLYLSSADEKYIGQIVDRIVSYSQLCVAMDKCFYLVTNSTDAKEVLVQRQLSESLAELKIKMRKEATRSIRQGGFVRKDSQIVLDDEERQDRVAKLVNLLEKDVATMNDSERRKSRKAALRWHVAMNPDEKDAHNERYKEFIYRINASW